MDRRPGAGHATLALSALAKIASTDFAAAQSPGGRAWIARLPALVREVAGQWDLAADGDVVWHGYTSVVLPVRGGGQRLALKLSWPPGRVAPECAALTAWMGHGAADRKRRSRP